MLDRDQEDLLGEVEWDYSRGQSFGTGEDDVLRWMLANGWTIAPPADRVPFQFPDEDEES